MSVEELRKIAKEEASKFIMENLNSAIIFTYIQNLEKVIEKQQKKIDELKEKNRELLKERAGYAEEYIHNNPWLYKQLDELYIFRGEVNKKFISVDKIKNKIEEVKSSKENYTFTLTSEDIRRTIITNLQELLKEE